MFELLWLLDLNKRFYVFKNIHLKSRDFYLFVVYLTMLLAAQAVIAQAVSLRFAFRVVKVWLHIVDSVAMGHIFLQVFLFPILLHLRVDNGHSEAAVSQRQSHSIVTVKE